MICNVLALVLCASGPAIGAPAPVFTATDMQGRAVRLADYKGKFVVLEWTNRDCPFVRKHYSEGAMQATQAWAVQQGVVWLGVVSSAPGTQGYFDATEARGYYQGTKWKGTRILLDPEGTVGRQYEAKTTPHMFVIDRDQKLVYMGAIDDRRTPNPADVAGATNYVRLALTELLAGKPVSVPVSKPYGCSVKYAG